MSDIYETELAYDAACKERGVNSHPMIQEVLTVDKEENLMWVSLEVDVLFCGFLWPSHMRLRVLCPAVSLVQTCQSVLEW